MNSRQVIQDDPVIFSHLRRLALADRLSVQKYACDPFRPFVFNNGILQIPYYCDKINIGKHENAPLCFYFTRPDGRRQMRQNP